MFYDKPSDLAKIAVHTSCTIFVTNKPAKFKNALYLAPDPSKKTVTITVEQMRDFLAATASKETTDRFFVITPADAMNEAAANAFLKTLEEPHDFCHFVLITENPAALLPTIRSRAQIFIQRRTDQLGLPPSAKPATLTLAKKLITASRADLPALSLEISKKSDARKTALAVTSTAIELLYKSYFKTGDEKWLKKLPNFLRLYDAISANGHIKLHLVADLC